MMTTLSIPRHLKGIRVVIAERKRMNMTKSTEEVRESLTGPVVAMTTPFNRDLSVDYAGLRSLTDYYIDSGIRTVIVAGSTGEFHTMSDQERREVIEAVVEQAGGRITVIAGCAHSGSALAADMVEFSEKVGADAAMVTPPYYGFSGFGGLKRHYEVIAERSGLGVVVYFSGAVMSKVQPLIADPTLLYELCDVSNVIAFKDATANYAYYRDISQVLAGKVAVMGSAGMNYYLWGHIFGSPCFLTGVGNIWPKVELEFSDALDSGDRATAERIVKEIDLPYLRGMTAAGHNYWAGVKVLLDAAGLPGGPVRPPLLDWPQADADSILSMAREIGLLDT